MQNDLHILNQAAYGQITLTPIMQSMLQDIYSDAVPATWLRTTFATCSSLKSWLLELPIRMNYVKDCLVHCPVILSLNMFLRPDKLFWAIIQTYALQNFKNITDIFLEFQVNWNMCSLFVNIVLPQLNHNRVCMSCYAMVPL